MDMQQPYPTTPDEFLAWNEGREGKREFVNGRVVEMMINVTRNHVRLATNLLVALRRRLEPTAYDVGSADFAVRTPAGVRYPDVFVDRRSARSAGHDLAATDPVMLAEVLSPSSYGRDFIEKLSDYQAIESALYYVIVSSDEPRVWLWERDGLTWLPIREIASEDSMLDLNRMEISFPLSEIYEGVDLRRPS